MEDEKLLNTILTMKLKLNHYESLILLFSIIRTLGDLEALLSKFKITVALVNGDKLADLAMKYELETSPSRDELLSVVVNLDTVMNEMNTPVSTEASRVIIEVLIIEVFKGNQKKGGGGEILKDRVLRAAGR